MVMLQWSLLSVFLKNGTMYFVLSINHRSLTFSTERNAREEVQEIILTLILWNLSHEDKEKQGQYFSVHIVLVFSAHIL